MKILTETVFYRWDLMLKMILVTHKTLNSEDIFELRLFGESEEKSNFC